MTDPLRAVETAFAAGDPEAALRGALAWWRAARDPAIAGLVDAISWRVSGLWVQDEGTWPRLARTRDPLVLGRLLAGMPALPASFLPTAGALLANFEADPRIAGTIAKLALDPPTTSSSTYPFWTKVLEILVATGDVRAIAALKKRRAREAGSSQFWPKFYASLARVIDKLEAMPAAAPLDGETAAAIARLIASADKLPRLGDRRASGIVAAAAKKKPGAPALTGPLLAQAAEHLASDRIEATLEVLVVHWRASRVQEVADLVDRANRLLPSWDRPLAASEKAMHAAWEAAFTEPAARMPQLLENLVVGPAKQLEMRLVDLANLGDDPRISMRLAQLASGCGVSPERTQFWRSVFELLARHRDIRTVEPLMREFEGFAGRYYNHHRQGNRIFGPVAHRAVRPELDTSDAKLAAKLDAQLAVAERAARRTELALLSAIAEAPTDDAPRTVYADYLIEREHPRGELLNLELIAKRSRAEEVRRVELLATPHIHGPLHDLCDELASDRGLPSALAIESDAGGLLLRELAAHPLLSLIETLAFDPDGEDRQPSAVDIARVLNAAPHLAKVTGMTAGLADEVARLTKLTRRGRALVR